MRRLTLLWWVSLPILCAVLDQLTKLFAERYLNHPLKVFPFLDLVVVYNTGFAFGVWQSSDNPLKVVFYYLIPLLVLSAVAALFFKTENKTLKFAFGLILGGGIGNLIDRLYLGYVRDFIDFHIGEWHYPAFNVADICVSLGILILLWEFLKRETKKV